jgi:hypothetical protein
MRSKRAPYYPPLSGKTRKLSRYERTSSVRGASPVLIALDESALELGGHLNGFTQLSDSGGQFRGLSG